MRLGLPLWIVASLLGVLLATSGFLMVGGSLQIALRPSFLLAGVFAGWTCALWTVASRARRDGQEQWLDALTGYYLALAAWWLTFLVAERVRICIAAGGWSDFDLHDHLVLIVWILALGTIPLGLILFPASLLARRLFWWMHLRFGRP